ncbi:carboxymuconolactone decarboxylase family protein [Rhodococcus sp. D2-41]|uniref:carboxymuconolactone decarboxylase family protein n=1 Tax=Speluncibacter jeojiensis TaxID=2710754 RepID=UPI0024105896|nr:carboxymuconolactone decarboxylase family protein [Rhodococcus sp. D2-41]MDG3011725.1 carboxymuconolactone decarboxylase family protein [Rhodococcus sp. D2-41]
MTRIAVVTAEQAGPATKLAYRYAKRRFGEVPEPFAVAANHPGLFRANAVHEMLADWASKVLPANVRDIAVYRVASTVGCSWCVDFGTMLQRLEGLDVDRLQSIDDYDTSALYSDDERAAIAYADAVSATPLTVTDEQVADLERRFGRDGVVELTYQVALEQMRSRMNAALGTVDQGFSSGAACRIPGAAQEDRG